jgi:hypothetical protein
MLDQIELEQRTPSTNTFWKIARPELSIFGADHESAGRRSQGDTRPSAKIVTLRDGKVSWRPLLPSGQSRLVEFYELRLGLGKGVRRASSGRYPRKSAGRERFTRKGGGGYPSYAGPGDAIEFAADVHHQYRNAVAAETIIYLVTTHSEMLT